MRDHRSLKKDLSILNAEGDILRLYTHTSGELYFKSRLTNRTGDVFYPVSTELIQDYLQSKLTLREVFLESPSDKVKVLLKGEVTTTTKDQVIEYIDSKDTLYQRIAQDLKNPGIEERFLGKTN